MDTKVEKTAGWGVIIMLAAAEFIMVLDTTVMNVSITQVAEDLNTTVVGMQTAITVYTLVMAAFMLIGGKLGERWGVKRGNTIGMLVYGVGSLTTALAPNLGGSADRVVVYRRFWRGAGDPGNRRLHRRHLQRPPAPAWRTASWAASAARRRRLVR